MPASELCQAAYNQSSMANEQPRLIDLLDDMSRGKDVFFQLVRHATDVMTKNVKFLTLNSTIEESLKFMNDNKVRHIPVIDSPTGREERRLVGIVSQRDIFRQISPYLGEIGELDSDSKALKLPLTNIITRNPVHIEFDTPITEAIKTMIDNRISVLPVLSAQQLTGIITTADILRLFVTINAICQLCRKMKKKTQGQRFVDMLSGSSEKSMLDLSTVLNTAEDIMTAQVVSLNGEQTLKNAIEVMQKQKIRHLPIIGKQNKLTGIVSDKDVLRHLPFHNRQFSSQDDKSRSRLFDVAPNEPAALRKLNRVMNTDVIHILPSCDFYNAVEMLYDKKISCLPVTDEQKNLIGIVTVTDVMRGLLAVYKLFDKIDA